jgi:hypothetical protein
MHPDDGKPAGTSPVARALGSQPRDSGTELPAIAVVRTHPDEPTLQGAGLRARDTDNLPGTRRGMPPSSGAMTVIVEFAASAGSEALDRALELTRPLPRDRHLSAAPRRDAEAPPGRLPRAWEAERPAAMTHASPYLR